MPKLYVANTTKQRFELRARFKGFNKEVRRTIEPGKQVLLGNFDQDEIDDIVNHHAQYGMRSVEDASRVQNFVGQYYSIGEPVTIEDMMQAFEKNGSELDKAATKRNMETAVAISDNIATNLSQMTGLEKERLRPARVELETVEDTLEKPTVATGVEVVDPSRAKPRRVQ